MSQHLQLATEMMRAHAGLHPDQATLHIGKPRFDLAARHFCRSTIAPRLSCPTTWNEFFLISMPITATVLLSFCDMACSFSSVPSPASHTGEAGARPDNPISGHERRRRRRGRRLCLPSQLDRRIQFYILNGFFGATMRPLCWPGCFLFPIGAPGR